MRKCSSQMKEIEVSRTIDDYNCKLYKFSCKREVYKIMVNQMESMLADIYHKEFLCYNMVRHSYPIFLDNHSILQVKNLYTENMKKMNDYEDKLSDIRIKSKEILKDLNTINALNTNFSKKLKEEIKRMERMEVNISKKRKREKKGKKENKERKGKERMVENEGMNEKRGIEEKKEGLYVYDIYSQLKMSKKYLSQVKRIMEFDFEECVHTNKIMISEFYNNRLKNMTIKKFTLR